eukprot:TRINITY_DN772_c0_g1_i1.p1 TRINITY_DN772_c0_g1~~TRINITY_DN772_c0_g1_i1.p1  ORF type:complete len:361 (+),score=109.62 TRINITY_DN772_c0_g1_i1:51-1085(+)
MGGVKRAFQLRGGHWETVDPYHFVAFHADRYPVGMPNGGVDGALLRGRSLGSDFSGKDGWSMYHGEEGNIPGFPKHPHYGFETVSIVQHGLIDHSDSLGSCGRFGNGDVQWMTAGNGVQHSEMFPLRSTTEPNPMEMFQIWLNLPSKSKRAPPNYKMLWAEDILNKTSNDGTAVKVVADASMVAKDDEPRTPPPDSWAADPSHNTAIHVVTIPKGGVYTLPPLKCDRDEVSRVVYFYKGDGAIEVAGDVHQPRTGIELDPTVGVTVKSVDATAHLLLLQGKKINEPSYHHGPFLGNTQADVMDAMKRYRETLYGGWPWKSDGPVHNLKRGRFAKYVDGTVVERD